MSIQSNFPNLKPSLLLDFANTKQLDNRVTFTRSTPAVYYDGETSVIAEQNFLPQSQALNLSPWSGAATVTSDTDVAPDGTTTADTFNPSFGLTNVNRSQTGTVNQTGTYTISIYAKVSSGTGKIYLSFLENGWSGATITTCSLTTTWQRFTATKNLTAGNTWFYVVGQTVDSTDATTCVVWGAQYEQRSTETAYIATTTQPITNYIPVLLTAGGNQPRFDCNPTTGESLGLLIEEQRTNLVSYSAQFDNAYWTKLNCLITANSNVAPDGTLSADLATATSGTEEVYTFGSKSASAITYTWSVYAKAYFGVTTGFSIYLSDNLTGQATGTYNFSAVSASASNGSWTNSSATITSVGNGWFRCTLTATSPANTGLLIGITWGASSGQAVFLWGCQLEQASFATSYIATTSASATRTADNASMTGTNFSSWFNNSGGTLYGQASFVGYTPATSSWIAQISDGTTNNNISCYWYNGTPIYTVESNASLVVNLSSSAISANQFMKFALVNAFNNSAVSFNADTVLTDTSCTLALNLNKLNIGSTQNYGGQYLNGYIKKIAYYPLPVTNTNLQALTS